MYLAINRAKYLLLLLVLGFASICQGIGFGELKLYSFLGEPLYAEIAITGFEGMDPHLMQVSLASAKDFLRSGIDRPYFLNSLAFQIITHDQQMYVVVRTNKSVQIPYVEFLVELAWPGGELIKEYTILLDPPPANLSADTRPKGVGQQAALAAQQTSTNSQIQEQMDLQKAAAQKAAAEQQLSDVVREGHNKFSDNTFDIKQSKNNDLVPGVVPEIPDQTEEYNKQLQSFEQQQTQKTKDQPKSFLQKAVSEIGDFDQNDEASNLTVKSILAEESKQNPAQPADTTKAPAEEPVDFNQVIKPSTKKPATPTTPSAPDAQAPADGHVLKAPPTTPAAPPEKGNHVYLGIILSLLLIAAGVVIAIKRGLLTNILHKTSAAEPSAPPEKEVNPLSTLDEVPVNDHANDQEIHEAAQQFAAEFEDLEEIELAPVAAPEVSQPVEPPAPTMLTAEPVAEQPQEPITATPAPSTPDVALDVPLTPDTPVVGVAPAVKNIEDPELTKFEEEFANINLDELSAPIEPNAAAPIKIEPTIEDTPIEPAPIVPTEPVVPSIVNEVIIPPSIATPVTTSDPAMVLEEVAIPPSTETPETTLVIEEVATTPPTIEEAPSTTVVDEVLAPSFEMELKLEGEELAASTPTLTASAPEPQIDGPTLIAEPTQAIESTLKLSEEGASLVSASEALDNEPEIAMKIQLARQYIETGDNDSAKDILRAVIETANDEQKQEAKVLLTSIE